MTSPTAGAPALKKGYVNTETASPGEAKGLRKKFKIIEYINKICNPLDYNKDS